MLLLLFLFGIFFAFGLYSLLTVLFCLPSLGTVRAMLHAKGQKKKVKNLEALLYSCAVKSSGFIRMDKYKRSRMCATLKAADIPMTPEVYTAYAIVKAGSIHLGLIPCLLLIPLLSPVFIILSVMVYFKEIRRADECLKNKQDEIEGELPRFVATIEQELKSSRDVLSIIENFKKNAGAVFASELGVLTADMRSSSYEAALSRFEARLCSPQVSDVVRGLIGVLRGDDSAVYFQMLSRDFKQLELQRLKKQAQKIPPKIRVLSFVMLMCFLLTYLVVIAMQAVQSLSSMF